MYEGPVQDLIDQTRGILPRDDAAGTADDLLDFLLRP